MSRVKFEDGHEVAVNDLHEAVPQAERVHAEEHLHDEGLKRLSDLDKLLVTLRKLRPLGQD